MEQGTITIASKRAEPLTKRNVQVILGMLQHASRHDELVDFLRSDLFRVVAHDEVNFVRGAIDLGEQALQIDRAAGAGRRDDKFHGAKESHSPCEH